LGQNLVNIEIDGKQVAIPAGSMVMHGANALGIYIPHFCYHKKLSIAANCRMCLVQVEKAPKPLPACATPVTEGMKVWTRSELALDAQRGVMEFLLVNHPLDCPICDQGGECQLQDLAVGYGGVSSRYAEEKRAVANKNLGALISTEARSLRAATHRGLVESIERRAQLVWVPVTVATLVPGLILIGVPSVSAMKQVTG